MSRLPLLLLLSWLFWLGAAPATARATEPKDRAFSSGLALGASAGSESPMFGGVLLYYLQLRDPRLRFAFHVGAGGAPRAIALDAWSLVGGSFFAYGRSHRLVVGVSGGAEAWEELHLHGTRLASRPLFGVGLSLGWEWMSSFGLFLRSTLGPVLHIARETPLSARELSPWIQAGLTIGYKIW